MKKLFLLPAFLISTTILVAQPTVTDVFPEIGDVGSVFSVDAFVPDMIGADAIWDYSDLSSDVGRTFNYVDPATTPYAANFPTATIASEENGNYEFQLISGTKGERLGVGGLVLIDYSNPATYYETSLTFGQNVVDDFEATFNSGGIDFTRTGTVDIKYAGYGKLILPSATLNDVVVYEVVEDYTDEYFFMGAPLTIDYFVTTYIWLHSGTHYPPLSTTSGTVSGGQDFSAAFYGDIVSVDAKEELSNLSGFSVFPNPANEFTNLELDLLSSEEVSISVLDMTGKALLQVANETLPTGKHNYQVDLDGIPTGMYFAKVRIGDQVETRMFVKK